jgi:molecular chaperone GrpE
MSLSKDKGNRPPKTAAPQDLTDAQAENPAADITDDAAARLLEKTKEAEEYHDRLLRLAAEMENLKKRLEREKGELLQFANESLIKELLPVVDNLELALEHGRRQDAPPALLEGIELVHHGFLKTLARFGVTPLNGVGEPFDPAFHNAVLEEETSETPDCTVTKELQRGYLLHQRLLRPAMVVVARNPQPHTKSEKD